jgi:hypothetical protein
MFWSLINIHPPQTNANGAGRHNDDPMAILPQLDGCLYYRGQDGKEWLMALFIHNGTGSYSKRGTAVNDP